MGQSVLSYGISAPGMAKKPMSGTANQLLLNALRQPQDLASYEPSQWDHVMPRARRAGVFARLAMELFDRDLYSMVPRRVCEHLEAMRVVAVEHNRIVRWEVNRITQALCTIDTPVVLLKGAAYVMTGLPPSRGRLVSDVDILVAKEKLNDVEAALIDHGWEPVKLDPYDQRYYRKWMHELPPLQHKDRLTVIDVHHTILPETSRLKPDPKLLLNSARAILPLTGPLYPDAALLLESARKVDGFELKVLAPQDMVLHTSVHLFQDGEVAGGLRDLTDINDLLRHFAEHEDSFWDGLVPRAAQLGLERPLFYALRYAKRLLHTPIPDRVDQAIQAGSPPVPVVALMDALVERAMIPEGPDGAPRLHHIARWLLYVRSHWLRMPLHLLASHLARKALRRWTEEEPQEDDL